MKATLFLLLASFAAVSAAAQGVVIFFNDSGILSSPPDRLIRFAAADAPGNPFGTNLAPAVGTNLLVQLYYGASTSPASSLVPISTPPASLRPSTTSIPGTWRNGGTRTLDGFFCVQVTLQVRVWDFFDGATYEEAQANNASGIAGVSRPFLYLNPCAGPVVPFYYMQGFEGFNISVPEPTSCALIVVGITLFGFTLLARNRPPQQATVGA